MNGQPTDPQPLPPRGSAAEWAQPGAGSAPAANQWRRLRGLATALTVLLWCAAVAAAFALIAFLNQRRVVEDFIDGFDVTLQEADDADALVGAAVILVLGLMIAILVLMIIFMFRASKNLEAIGRTGARLSPGWSIGGWFIPLANLVIPVLIAQDLWRGSDPAAGPENWRGRIPGSGLIGAWWAAWIATSVFQYTTRFGDEDSLDQTIDAFRFNNTVNLLWAVSLAVAAVLAIVVFRRLADRFEALGTAIVGPSSPVPPGARGSTTPATTPATPPAPPPGAPPPSPGA